jgi:hypothetical protein
MRENWTYELCGAMDDYITQHGLDPDRLLRVDVVLILLRLGDNRRELRQECSQRVAELTGKAILQCPAAMPPWPPKPCAVSRPVPRAVVLVLENPCSRNTDMYRRFGLVRQGMTQEQMVAHGVTPRDIRVWRNKGWLKMQEVRRGS